VDIEEEEVEIEYTDDFPDEKPARAGASEGLSAIGEERSSQFTASEYAEDISQMKGKRHDVVYEQFDFAKRDPEEEFFMLAVLAMKMVHTEEYDESEYIYEVSAVKLFKQVKENDGLPFHRWYKWLEQKFHDLRDAFLAE
jgi:hypothetical protein